MNDKPKILIVDDKRENLLALRKVLRDLDVEFFEAITGNDALSLTLTHDFAMAVLDVHMPGMDGYELADLLRGDTKTAQLPIIFLTAAYGEEEHVFRGYESGAVDYIIKPYDPAILRAKICIFLELHQRNAALAEKVAALAASEERFRSLVMTVPDIVYRIDPDGRFTFLNDAVSTLGYRPEDLLGMHFSEIMHPSEAARVSREVVLATCQGVTTGPDASPKLFDERRTAQRKTAGLEVCLVPRGGAARIPGMVHNLGEQSVVVEVSSSGLWTSGPGPHRRVFLGTVGIIRDISERKRAQHELERHREHLQELVDIRVMEQSCLFRISRLLADSTRPLGELLQEAVTLIPAGWARSRKAFASLSLGDLNVRSEGPEANEWCAEAEVMVGGIARGLLRVHCCKPATERTDEALVLADEVELTCAIARMIGQTVEQRESEARVRRLFDASPDALFVLGKDGTLAELNRVTEAWLGFPRQELLGMALADLSVKPAEGPDSGAQWLASDAEVKVEWALRASDGHVLDLEISATPFVLDGKTCLLCSGRDIAERRRAEEEKVLFQTQLLQSQRLESIGTLASGVAHEINNPLNVVMNFAQLILDDPSTSPDGRESATTIIAESERMARIVRNLLAFSRLDKNASSVTHVRELVESTVSLLYASFRKDQILLTFDIPNDLARIRCKAQQIQQVLINLLTNARDALDARFPGASPDKWIRIGAELMDTPQGPWLRLTVADNGEGIAPSLSDRVFDPFFTTKPKDKGTGLGLSISYGIAKEHGGRLWFESRESHGCSFHLDVPVEPDDPGVLGTGDSTLGG